MYRLNEPLTLCMLAKGITFANSLDQDLAQYNVGLILRSKLFDNLILFLQNEEENIIYKNFVWDINNLSHTNYPACKKLNIIFFIQSLYLGFISHIATKHFLLKGSNVKHMVTGY